MPTCPVCPLQQELETTPRGWFCRTCSGQLLDLAAVRRHFPALGASPGEAAVAGDRKLRCPLCAGTMAARVVGSVTVDRCPACAAVFLDAGEFQRLDRQAPAPAPAPKGFKPVVVEDPEGRSGWLRPLGAVVVLGLPLAVGYLAFTHAEKCQVSCDCPATEVCSLGRCLVDACTPGVPPGRSGCNPDYTCVEDLERSRKSRDHTRYGSCVRQPSAEAACRAPHVKK